MISPPSCHLTFLIVVLEIFKLEWQCSEYGELNPTCAECLFSSSTLETMGYGILDMTLSNFI